MKRLSAMDAKFLSVETSTTVGHVGSLIVLDPSTAPVRELSLDAVRQVLEPRLHLAAPLRQRLVKVPLALGIPYWVDDPDFDIEFHLREVGLPRPGSQHQLAEQVARIHARPLDQSRPLWEMYLVHNVSGNRQALYTKIHHAAIDGVSGAEILATVLDVTVEPRVEPPPDDVWNPPGLPSGVDLVTRSLAGMATHPLDLARTLPRALPHLADVPGANLVPGVTRLSDAAGSIAGLAPGAATRRPVARRTLSPPPTPFNAPITAHRRFAYGSLLLEDVKRVKNALGMTVNDVVMALCASVLRRWLLDHDALPDDPIVAAVPVSVRTDEEKGGHGNQVSIMLAELPTHVGDAAERCAAVQVAMAEAKEQFDAVPATILQDLAAAIPTALSGLAARAAFRMVTVGALPFNLFVSNVPGPQLPLYVGGARVLGIYPASAVTDLTGALNITLFSYDGSLDFGLIACREIVPDVWNLIGYLEDALAELLDLVAE
jgi:WS/DGAT/MGAT family acyltransferase